MKKIKEGLLFLLTIAVILLVIFMIFGTVVLFMHFGANKESLVFLAVTVVVCVPGFIYLNKQLKKLMGTS